MTIFFHPLVFRIEINKLKSGYFEAKLIDSETNNPVEFRKCDSEKNVNEQIKDRHKRFKMIEASKENEV